jgi:hypothetical protein
MKTWALGAAVLCVGAPAFGADFDYRASLGAGYSDNVRRTATDEINESIAMAGLRFAVNEDTRRLQADVVGDLAYYSYLSNTYENELVGSVYADTEFTLLPERITWALSDQFGQVAIDPFQPATPDNRENINYFSTGPDFTVGLGSQFRLRLGGRYSLITYEEDPLDATVTGGQVALVRSLSGRSSVSLNGSLRQTEYDDPVLNSNFDQMESYFRYEVQGARTNLAVDAGYTKLEREALDVEESGALLRFDLSRRMSSSSVLSLSGAHEFSTSAGAFAGDLGAHGGVSTAPGRQTADPFTLDRATLGWSFNRNVTSISAAANWSEQTYDTNTTLDQTTMVLAARYRRDLSAATSMGVNVSHTAFSYVQSGADYDELTVGVSYSWRMSRSLTLDIKYDYADRSGDATMNVFKENHLWLMIGYGRGDPRGERRAPTFGVDSATPGN